MAGDERSSAAELVRAEPPPASSREKILDAAVQVAIRDGILAMTLDAVAKEAGVSKGGLIYHFRSKDELIAAMLVHFRAKTQGTIEARAAADPQPRGRWFRAVLYTIWRPAPTGDAKVAVSSEMSRFFTAMLAASANNPHLLDPVRHNHCQMRERLISEGPNGLRQVALSAAIHGLLLWQNLGILLPDDPLYQPIIDELLTLAEGPDPSQFKE
jgi:AcrR family transcriptional regulator